VGTYKSVAVSDALESPIFFHAVNLAQAKIYTSMMKMDEDYYPPVEATQEEIDALINSHSYPVEGE